MDRLGALRGFGDINEAHLKNVINCCYPESCDDFQTQQCEEFGDQYPRFSNCKKCVK